MQRKFLVETNVGEQVKLSYTNSIVYKQCDGNERRGKEIMVTMSKSRLHMS